MHIASFPGFEYTVDSQWTGFGPVEKTYHLCRRRRWVRERKLVKDLRKAEAEKVNSISNFILSIKG